MIGNSSPGELLVCNGSTWGLAEAITSGGNVGIGTTNPGGYELAVSGSVPDSANTSIQNTSVSGMSGINIYDNTSAEIGAVGYANASFPTIGGEFVFGTYSTKDIVFLSNSTERLRITSGGNVGIGTTSPNALLDIGSTGTTLGTMRLESSTASSYVQLQPSTTSGSWTLTLPSSGGSNGYMLQTNGSGVTSWVAAGTGATITLGTSASVTNPQRIGETGTGLFSATSGQVSIATTGTEVGRWTSTGLNITLAPSSGTYQGSVQISGNNALWQDNSNFNLAVGPTAFPTTVSQSGGGFNGEGNIAIGYQALNANTTGQTNTALGYQTMAANTAGYDNTAMGSQALNANTTGNGNTALGQQALYTNSTGSDNVAVGVFALYANTTGSYNTAVGYEALDANTTGTNNTGIGFSALLHSTTATNNSAFGTNTLITNTTGSNNTANGYNALSANTTGQKNTVLGSSAMIVNTTGMNNVAIGYNVAGTTLATGSNNILIGTSNAVDTASSSTNYNLNVGNLLQGDMTNSTSTYNKTLYLQSTTSAVNYFQIAGAATTAAPVLSAQGSDTNISMELLPKGTGGVGIGTAAPATLLDVNGLAAVRNVLWIQGSSTVTSTQANGGGVQIDYSSSGNYGRVSAYNYSNSTWENLFLQQGGGNVGIGTTSPDALLSLGNAITTIKVAAYDGGSSNLYGMGVNPGELTFGAAISTSGTPQMVLTNAGLVGIGSTSPAVSLDVSQNTDAVSLPAGTTSQRPTGVNGMVRYNTTTAVLEAYVNGTWIPVSGLQLISTQIASSSSSLAWTGLGSSFYYYKLLCTDLQPSSTSANLGIQFGEGATPTWKTGNNYPYAIYDLFSGNSTPNTSITVSQSNSYGLLAGASGAANNSFLLEATFTNLASTSLYKQYQFMDSLYTTGMLSYSGAQGGTPATPTQ